MNPFTTNNARLLSDGQVVKTHEASLEILREVYARHGCGVDTETLRVKFPPAVAKEAIDSIPPTFTFSAEVDAEIRSQFENMVPGKILIPEGW